MKIFINPGHGGNDPGACGNGLQEAVVCLKIGQRVENYLRAVGYDVKLFQYDGLGENCNDCNAFKADLFVSIHCNAATDSVQGTEIYATKGRKLAEKIHAQITSSLPVVNRGVKEAGFFVLANTDCPDVIDTPKNSSGNVGKHFSISEFVCYCCGGAEKIAPRLIELLEELRAKATDITIPQKY